MQQPPNRAVARSVIDARLLAMMRSTLLRRDGRNARPLVHLDAGNELVATIGGTEDRGLAFLDVEPILAERCDDVRLMGDEDRIGMILRRDGEHLSEGSGTPVVLVRRDDQPTLGQISRLLDVRETGDDGGLKGAVIFAGIHLADGNAGLTQRVTERLRQRLALVVQITLSRDVVEVKRVGVGLVRKCCAMTNDKDETAGAKGLCEILVIRAGRRRGHCKRRKESDRSHKSRNRFRYGKHHLNSVVIHPLNRLSKRRFYSARLRTKIAVTFARAGLRGSIRCSTPSRSTSRWNSAAPA